MVEPLTDISLYLDIAIYIAIVFLTFLFMEWVAWFLHKYVMHGFGWYLHEDHHRASKGRFEKNDLFAVIFSFISFAFFYLGG